MVQNRNVASPHAENHRTSATSCDALFVQNSNPEIVEVFLLRTGEGALPSPSVKHRAVSMHCLVSMSPLIRDRCLESNGSFLLSQVELSERLRDGRTLTELQELAVAGGLTVSAWESFLGHVVSLATDCHQEPLLERIDILKQKLVNLSICNDTSTHDCLVLEAVDILSEVRKCASSSCSFADEMVAIKSHLRAALRSNGSGLLRHSVTVIGHLRQLVQAYIPRSKERNAEECAETLQLLLLAVALRAEHLVSMCLNAIAQRWPEMVLCPTKFQVDAPNADAVFSLLPPAVQEQLGCLLGTTPMARSLLEQQQQTEHCQNSEETQIVHAPSKSEDTHQVPLQVSLRRSSCHIDEQTDTAEVKCTKGADVQTQCEKQGVDFANSMNPTAIVDQNASNPANLNGCTTKEPAKGASSLTRQSLFEQRTRQLQEQLQKLPLRGFVVTTPFSAETPALPESRLRQPMKRKSYEQMPRAASSKNASDCVDSPPPLQAKPTRNLSSLASGSSCSEGESGPASSGCNIDALAMEKASRTRSISAERLIAHKFLKAPVKTDSLASVVVHRHEASKQCLKDDGREIDSQVLLHKHVTNDSAHGSVGHVKTEQSSAQTLEPKSQHEACTQYLKDDRREGDSQVTLHKNVAKDLAHRSVGHAKTQHSSVKNLEPDSQSQISKAAALAAMWLANDEPLLSPFARPRNEASGAELTPKEEDCAAACNGQHATIDASYEAQLDGSQRPQLRFSESAAQDRHESVETAAVRRAQRRLVERRRKKEQSQACQLSESEVRRAELFRKRDERIRSFLQRQDGAPQDASRQHGCSPCSDQVEGTPSPDSGTSGSFSDLMRSTHGGCKTPLDTTVMPEADTPSPPCRVASRIAEIFVADCVEDEDICRPIPPQPYPMS